MMSATVHSMNAVTAPTILDDARVTRFRSARVVVAIGSSRSLASSPRCAFSRRAHRDGRAAA
jgi:hypothetical protein